MIPLKLDILTQTDLNLVLVIEGISIEMINALRRIILTEIPVMAIDEVIILKNDSPLYDEIISHRLGLIPLKTDLEVYKLPRECDCGGFGCPLCQVSLTCEITNNSNTSLEIFSGDLKSNDPKIIPVDPNIPIVKIDKNDKVIIEAYAILGLAKDHAKWQAVSNVAYRHYPIVEIDDKSSKNLEVNSLIVKMCPEKLFKLTNNDSLKLKEDYWKYCTLCMSCENNSEGKIKVSQKEDVYILSIESDGVLEYNVLISHLFRIFNEKIDEFITNLEELDIES
ncbi:MAG: DNA-directed RNA polymerase subunit D [Candidatus Lokiarchaeota archaeon]|nr:DNA-directed RNA polymerase subunit D [Candidatus Lokiarchaeota archaeon]